MMAALLGVGLVNAAQVVLLDPSGSYFKSDASAKTELGVADMVSRTFYLRGLSDGAHTSALKQPRHSPTDNVMMSIYGVDPSSLSSLQSHTAEPLTGGAALYSASLLASTLHDVVPEATSISTLITHDKRTQLLAADADVTKDFTEGMDLNVEDPMIEAFLREVHLCKKAADSLGSASSKKPQMSFLQITSFPTLSEKQQSEALKVVDKLVNYVIEKMPRDSTGQLMFRDSIDLAALSQEQTANAFRRRLQSDDGNSTSNVTGITYIDVYTAHQFYWFLIASIIIVYVFSYCFAGMVYDDDKMLYTTFDANFGGDRKVD